MFVVLVEFETRDGYSDRFRERVRRQAQDSLSLEPDCEIFDVCIDPADPSRVLLYEVYRDAAAFDRHLQSDHFLDFDRSVRDWIEAKSITRLERIEPD